MGDRNFERSAHWKIGVQWLLLASHRVCCTTDVWNLVVFSVNCRAFRFEWTETKVNLSELQKISACQTKKSNALLACSGTSHACVSTTHVTCVAQYNAATVGVAACNHFALAHTESDI